MKSTKLQPLELLAQRYVWWASVAWALDHPHRFYASVMNLGSWDDILLLLGAVDEDTLRDVLLSAPPGVFSQRSWDFWHVKLGVSPIPPLPVRRFDET